ncbi:hypothetical protein Tco_0963348 [Tanacetum coccineum]
MVDWWLAIVDSRWPVPVMADHPLVDTCRRLANASSPRVILTTDKLQVAAVRVASSNFQKGYVSAPDWMKKNIAAGN